MGTFGTNRRTRLTEWLRSETVWDRGLLPRGLDSLRISMHKSSYDIRHECLVRVFTWQTSHLTCHMSHVTWLISWVMRVVSDMRHASLVSDMWHKSVVSDTESREGLYITWDMRVSYLTWDMTVWYLTQSLVRVSTSHLTWVSRIWHE